MKKSLKIAFFSCLLVFSWRPAVAEIVEEGGEFIVVSKVNPLKDSKEEQSLPQNLPLPENIKIVSNLAFGGRFYLSEDKDTIDPHEPPAPWLLLYSPYADWHARNTPNELDFSLEQSDDKYICKQGLPYILSIFGTVKISELEFAKHTDPASSIGRLWFDNGESVPLNSDALESYHSVNGKDVKQDFFYGALDRFRHYFAPKDLDDEKKALEDSLNTRDNEHKAALLFQKHLPIAISYGDYAVSISYIDLAPVKEFQKYLNDPKLLKDNVEYGELYKQLRGCD